MTTSRSDELRALLIRNLETSEMTPFVRGSLYESAGASFSDGLAAKDLSVSIGIVPPGKRACPYHLHRAEEEMFIVLEGSGTLRVAGEMLPTVRGDIITIPAGREYPHSGKVHAFSKGRIPIHRKAESLDYEDGEPGA